MEAGVEVVFFAVSASVCFAFLSSPKADQGIPVIDISIRIDSIYTDKTVHLAYGLPVKTSLAYRQGSFLKREYIVTAPTSFHVLHTVIHDSIY